MTRNRPAAWTQALCYLLYVGGLTFCSSAHAYEFVFSEFNENGFEYLFNNRGSEQYVGIESVRLYDSDGAGGGGVYWGSPIGVDLSDFASSNVQINFTVESGNAADYFAFELIDTDGDTGKWDIDISSLSVGQAQQGVLSIGNLSTPDRFSSGPAGTTNGQLDLNNVRGFQIAGDYSGVNASPPVDKTLNVSFDRLWTENSLVAPEAYPGASPTAAWRAEAATAIDTHRKADLTVRVTDSNGAPLPGADVSVQMRRHAFEFGTAIATPLINSTDPGAATYRDKLVELFNSATTENALKWPRWDGDSTLEQWSQENTLAALGWLNDQGLTVRGHNMVWPGETKLPAPVVNLLQGFINSGQPLSTQQQATLRTMIAEHIEDVGSSTAGLVSDWDVVNEPRNHHLLMDALPEGDGAMADWFAEARAEDPNVRLYLNETGILTSGGQTDTPNQQQLYDTLSQLIADDAPVDGVGFQGHFRQESNLTHNLTGPEQLWEIYDRFAELGVDLKVTEFDFLTQDETLQADYLRDFLTAAFAHEAVDGVTQWGFWAGSHWRPNAALFRSDWSIKPSGQAYLDLVLGEWWTDEQLDADGDGDASVRGFRGEYEVTITVGEHTVTLPATLGPDGLVLETQLAIQRGDFNGDGQIDHEDLDLLAAAEGTSDPLFDLDGDGSVSFFASGAGVSSDSDYLVRTLLDTEYGDANLDGRVDVVDLDLLDQGFQGLGAGWLFGDFSGSGGPTDVVDLDLLDQFFGFNRGTQTATTPEPTGTTLLLGAGAGSLVRRVR